MLRNEALISWNIVLLDADVDALQIHAHLLAHMGHHVASFASPLAALAYIQNHPDSVDLLITGFKMPELDGLQLIQRVRQLQATFPVLVLTAFAEDLLLDTVADACSTHVMSKPARYSEIAEHIESLQSAAQAGSTQARRYA